MLSNEDIFFKFLDSSTSNSQDEIVSKEENVLQSITQYRPAFFEGFENETVEFSTTEELLNIPFVKNFMSNTFSGFAMSDNLLMATYENGNEWFIVGRITKPDLIELPKWEAKKAPQ